MIRFLALGLVCCGCRCGNAVFSADEAARICLTLQTCSPEEFAATFGNSVEACTGTPSQLLPWPGTLEVAPLFTTGMDTPAADIYRCMLEAHGDCAKAGRCWAPDGDAGSCTQRIGLTNGSCRDKTMSSCTLDGQRLEVSCPSACESVGSFGLFGVCAVAKCPSRAELKCRGDQAEVCTVNALMLLDCARLGKKCESLTDGGGAICVTGDRTCDPMAGQRCEGTVAIVCEGLGFESRIDCANNATHRRCSEGRCVETGTECFDLKTRCEDTALQFCQDGFLRKLDCVGAGFGGCDGGACTEGQKK